MNRKTILVVDDEPDIRRVLCGRLESEGFKCLTAANGEQALDVARQEKPSLIILDMVMPKKDGIQTYKELKACHELKDIPIIVYTARSPDQVVEKGFEAIEIVDFVFKPFDSKALVFLINQSLRKVD